MKRYKLENFTRGWLLGDFTPNVFRTKHFEFGVKKYKKGDKETAHYHKVATEISVVVSGEFKMNRRKLKAGDVIIMEPNDVARFSCIKAGCTAIVKMPSVKEDKYIVNNKIKKYAK